MQSPTCDGCGQSITDRQDAVYDVRIAARFHSDAAHREMFAGVDCARCGAFLSADLGNIIYQNAYSGLYHCDGCTIRGDVTVTP